MNTVETKAYRCGICERTFSSPETADSCCSCCYCKKAVNLKAGDFSGYHSSCYYSEKRKRDQAAFDKANKITAAEHEGYVYTDAVRGGNDGYFSSMDELLEAIYDAVNDNDMTIDDVPEYVFACVPEVHSICYGDVIENLCADGYEDMADHVVGEKELRAAIDAFNAQNAGLVSWCVDHKTVVRVPIADLKLPAE